MSWKPEVLVEGKWSSNALAFETEEEATAWGRDLLMRWFVPTDSRAVESDEEVSCKLHRMPNGGWRQEKPECTGGYDSEGNWMHEGGTCPVHEAVEA